MKKLFWLMAGFLSIQNCWAAVNSDTCPPAEKKCAHAVVLREVIEKLGTRVFKTDQKTNEVVYYAADHKHAGYPLLIDAYRYSKNERGLKYVCCRDEEDTDDGKEGYNLALFKFYKEHRIYCCRVGL
jgi:hypothetical protein